MPTPAPSGQAPLPTPTPPSAPTSSPPQTAQSEAAPPCQADAVDDYYTGGTDFGTIIPYEAGLGINDVLCEGSGYTIDDLTDPAFGTVVKTPNEFGAFEYDPDFFTASDSFTYTLYEDGQAVDQATVHIDTLIDCSVVGFHDSYSTAFETPLDVAAPGFVDNDTLELTFACAPVSVSVDVASPPTHGSVTLENTGGFSYTPDAGFSGDDTFSYQILNQNQGVMGGGAVTIHVAPPKCTAVDDAYSTEVDTALTVSGPGLFSNDVTDPCPAIFSLTLDQPPLSGVATLQVDGSFEYVPDPGFVGQDSFVYAWSLGSLLLTSATVVIDVTEPGSPTTTVPAGDTTTTTTTTTTTGLGDTTTTSQPDGTTTTTLSGEMTTTTITSDDSAPSTEPDEPTTTGAGTEQESASSVSAGGFRVATFNASLTRGAEGELLADLSTPDDQQARNVAAVLQHTRPDIVLLNEFDYVEGGAAVEAFRTNYLLASQGGAQPLEYPYYFIAPSNTGVPSGFDLDNDGTVGGPNDAFGFGEFPGQYGMVVLSRFPIVEDEVRTFQNLLWADMPGARLPDDPATADPDDWYSPNELTVLRLSSKSHWDVPIDVDGRVIHVLASHPTPPVFDGAEDRNGLRNADEIALWADYVAGAEASWIVDDAGVSGGLPADAEFVIVGDLNSDPLDGDSLTGATEQLLALDRVEDPAPTSAGAVQAADVQHRANETHAGDPALDTADFADDAPGNLRVDYVLPSDGIDVTDAGVFWPTILDPLARLVTMEPLATSDHRLVWVDLA